MNRCSIPVRILRGLPLARAAALAIASLYMTAPAMAGEAEKAEHIQLYEEMRKYAARNAWAGVEAIYKRLLELEKKGEKLNYEDHRLGAESARATGDMQACRDRLARAAAAKPSDEVNGFLSEIDANFGAVDVHFDSRAKEGASAVPAMPPFAGAGSCVAGACVFACTAPRANCDSMAANGCETDLSTSAANCGACRSVCNRRSRATFW